MTQFTTSDYDTSKTYSRITGIWYVESSVYVSAGWRRDDTQGSTSQLKDIVPVEQILEIIAEAQLKRSKVKPLRPSAKRLQEKRQAESDAKDLYELQVLEALKPYCPEGASLMLIRDEVRIEKERSTYYSKQGKTVADTVIAFRIMILDMVKQQKERAEFERLRQLKRSK